MGKKSNAVAEVTLPMTETENVIPVVLAESILPALSVDALITALTNPESRASTALQLDVRIAARKAELDQLMVARKALDFVSPMESNTKEVKSGGDGENGNHSTAILNALKNEKSGLTIGDLRLKLQRSGHMIEQKNLASYVWSMTKSGKILKEGPRGQFKYKAA